MGVRGWGGSGWDWVVWGMRSGGGGGGGVLAKGCQTLPG